MSRSMLPRSWFVITFMTMAAAGRNGVHREQPRGRGGRSEVDMTRRIIASRGRD
jgi:hypothetical protein